MNSAYLHSIPKEKRLTLIKSMKKDSKLARIDSVLNIKLDEDEVIRELRD